ncbi:MAG TPA: hypothetical protein VHV08_11440, partial [Pirellulales bacterium]|nr:hypothetical protein [Pirellulales bacterium]
MLDSLEAGPPPLEPSVPSSGPHVLRSAALLACATVLVKLAAFFKDLLVARSFGAGDELDAFLIAFLVPSFGVTVLASSFAPAFMPSYI